MSEPSASSRPSKPHIFYGAGATEYDIPEGCMIWPVASDDADPDVSIARARVRPGDTTRWHRLQATDERYLITQGSGRVEVEGLEPSDVGPGDVVLIPRGSAQRITNTGVEDLLFWCICTPRFRPEIYSECEPPR